MIRHISLQIIAFLILLFTSFFNYLYGQEKGAIQSKYYSTKDYNAGVQNWAIAQDKRGILYFGNLNGVLEFDGITWRLIRVNNLSTIRSLAVDSLGKVFVGAYSEFGYLQPNARGDMTYHSLIPQIDEHHRDFEEVWDINCFGDTVFFLSDDYLFRYHEGRFDYWESGKNNFYLSYKVNNIYLVQELGKGLMRFQNNGLNLIEKGEFFADKKIHTILPISQGYLICTRLHGFYIYDTSGKKVRIKPLAEVSDKAKKLNNYFIEHAFYHGIAIHDNQFAMSTISGNVLIINQKWEVVDVIDHHTIGVKSPALFLYYQKNHSLWLGLGNGICQVEVSSPFRYWNHTNGLTGVLTDVSKIRDTLYISTASGIFSTSCTENYFEINNFEPIEGKFEQAWQFLYFQPPYLDSKTGQVTNSRVYHPIPDDHSILLASTRTGLYRIKGGESEKIFDYEGILRLHQSYLYPKNLLVGINNGLVLLTYDKGQWIDNGYQHGINARINDIEEDTLGNIWLSASYKGFFRIQNLFSNDSSSVSVELFDTRHGLPSLNSLWINDENRNLEFSAGEYYYTFNPTLKLFEKIEETTDADTTSSNQSIYSYPAWERINDDIITNYHVVKQGDTVVWFGTSTGVFKFLGRTNRNYHDLFPTIIRRVRTGDSILFNGANILAIESQQKDISRAYSLNLSTTVDIGHILKYKNNSLSFYYALPFFEGEKSNLFSFQLEGYDKNWSEWSQETRKEYTNLPEGYYTFKVKGKNFYGIESEPAEFKFTILPPWYRTILAYLGYFLLGVLFVVIVVKLYTYRLIIEKENLEGIVKERTQEILMQKEEILVQAEHLKETYDWIRAKNIELEYQKKAFERKKDQLEVSNATKNKFFRIIAHDLRNPISTLVSTTGYILTDIDEFDKEKMKGIIEDLNKLSLTTYNLLENLLDWSTSQMGEIKFNPKPVDLNLAVNDNIELISSKLQSKNIAIEVNLPERIEVMADENMVYTIIRNLITNAVKFSKENGTIRVYTVINKPFCSICIADDGVGISSDNLDKLFRIDKHLSTLGTHNEKGSGLGLILCKEFAEKNGGDISVESEPGKGSTFTLILKLST